MILKEKPSAQEVREELARIVSSRTFGPRSAIHNLLSWLVDRTLSDPDAPLKEYSIGVEAFGKSEGYDPQQDAYVRVQASKLRAKLQEYYLTEGASDRIRIELPKRQFLLEFHEQEAPAAPQGEGPAPRRVAPALFAILGCVLLVWAITATTLLFRKTATDPRISPDLAKIWAGFLHGGRPVLISLGTHQFYSYSRGFLREPALDAASPDELDERLETLARTLGSSPLHPRLGAYTGTGQATGAFLLGRFFGGAGSPIQLARSSATTWDDISRHSVIFLGSAKSNPQIRSIPFERAFDLAGEAIVNLRPATGEPKSWAYGPLNVRNEREEYALVSFAPGLHGSGEILIIEAASTTGMWAGARYLTDPVYARELVDKVSRDGQFPAHYQVVLHLFVRDSVPLKVRYEAHRPL